MPLRISLVRQVHLKEKYANQYFKYKPIDVIIILFKIKHI